MKITTARSLFLLRLLHPVVIRTAKSSHKDCRIHKKRYAYNAKFKMNNAYEYLPCALVKESSCIFSQLNPYSSFMLQVNFEAAKQTARKHFNFDLR